MSRSARAGHLLAAVAVASGLALALAPVASAVPPATPGPPAATSPAPTPGDPAQARRAEADQRRTAGLATAEDRRARARAAHDRYDAKAATRSAPADVAGWYVNEFTGETVISIIGAGSPAAAAFVADPDPAVIRVETDAPIPRRLTAAAVPGATTRATPLVDGQALYGGGYRCSIGFSVRAGSRYSVLTAGHCTESVRTWAGATRVTIGNTTRTAWPNDDFGSLSVSSTRTWTPTSRVEGGPRVTGSRDAALGAQVCRSGSTSGYRCGVIVSREQTVNYGDGDLVYGLTRTTACAEGGDSGGPFIEPATGQAQGLTSGGTGDCSRGGSTFFQPVNEVLKAMRVVLVTG